MLMIDKEYARIMSEIILKAPKKILEIGAADGFGTLMYHRSSPNSLITSIDINQYEPSYDKDGQRIRPKKTWQVTVEGFKSMYDYNIEESVSEWNTTKTVLTDKNSDKRIELICDDATNADLGKNMYDCLIIDADHSFQNNLGDYGIYHFIKEHLTSDCIIFIHDIYPINGMMTSDALLFFELSQKWKHEFYCNLGIVWCGQASMNKLTYSFKDIQRLHGLEFKFDGDKV